MCANSSKSITTLLNIVHKDQYSGVKYLDTLFKADGKEYFRFSKKFFTNHVLKSFKKL